MSKKSPADDVAPFKIAAVGDAPEEHLTEVGRVVVRWAHLEYKAHELLQALLGIPMDQYWLVRPTNADGLLSRLRRVAKLKLTDEAWDQFENEVIKVCTREKRGLKARRNEVTHSLWWKSLHPTDSPSPHRASLPFEGYQDLEHVDVEDLNALAKEIDDCIVKMIEWHVRFEHGLRMR